MKNKIEKYSELAMIRALPDFIVGSLNPGRLKNRCEKLLKLVDSELAKLPEPTYNELNKISDRIKLFGKASGWEGKQRHTVSVVSFLLAMIEESSFSHNQKIINTLNDIFNYFERNRDAKPLCLKSGEIASQKWEKDNAVSFL